MAKRATGAFLLLVAASAVAEAGPIRRRSRPAPGSDIAVAKRDDARAARDTGRPSPDIGSVAEGPACSPADGRRRTAQSSQP